MLRAETYACIRLLAVDRKMAERQEVIIISDDDEGVDVMFTLMEHMIADDESTVAGMYSYIFRYFIFSLFYFIEYALTYTTNHFSTTI